MEKNTKPLYDKESGKIRQRISVFVGTVLFSCILFCCTVWAESAYEENLAVHRQTAANTGSICGALFLGYVYGGAGDNIADDSAYRDYVLDLSGCADEFMFLRDIPTDRIVEIEGGKEVYCIYPSDAYASITVYEYLMNEANDYSGETGAVLYHSENGEPILLRCNVSEGISDCQVVITDSQGETLVWEPIISLYDGTISVPWEPPFIYDATYEAVDNYGHDSYGYEGEYETTYIMQVTECEEWVSLREYPDVNSARLAQVPLGSYMYDCQWYSDEFVFGQIDGQWGYVLSQYLTLVDVMPGYEDGDYGDGYDSGYEDPDYGELEGRWTEDEISHGYFNYTPLPYNTITKDGIEVINYSIEGYTVLASRIYDLGEVMRVGCYVNGTKPHWGYVTSVDTITESTATEAFLAGTAENPRVMIHNSVKGLYMIDLETGEVLWNKNSEELGIYGSLCYAVDKNGTMYLAGYLGTDIIGVSMDGDVLWRNDAEYSDIYWPYRIRVLDDEVVVDYESGTQDGHYVVAYGLDGSHQWLDIL